MLIMRHRHERKQQLTSKIGRNKLIRIIKISLSHIKEPDPTPKKKKQSSQAGRVQHAGNSVHVKGPKAQLLPTALL